MSPTATRIEAVQYLRGIAALAVALTHIVNVQRDFVSGEGVLLGFNGYWGVDIFFVISGFIIVHITRDVATGGRAAALFMLKRIVRIIPAYWCFTFFIYFSDTFHWLSEMPNSTNLSLLVRSLFFVKPGFPLLFVGWTLTLEMFFYMIYAFVLWRCNIVWRVWLVVSLFILLAVAHLYIEGLNRYAKFYTNEILTEFAAGMLIAYFCSFKSWRVTQVASVVIFFAGWALLVSVTVIQKEQVLITQRVFWWGVPAAIIVLGAVNMKNFYRCSVLSCVGAISYSLYLCHLPCAGISAELVKTYLIGMPNLPQWFVAIALLLTLIVSVISWLLLEYIPQKSLQKFLSSRK